MMLLNPLLGCGTKHGDGSLNKGDFFMLEEDLFNEKMIIISDVHLGDKNCRKND